MEHRLKLDLDRMTVRDLNQFLHAGLDCVPVSQVDVLHPNGLHNIAVGVDAPVNIDIFGHAGYFIGGMNKQANITVHGSVSKSVAENIMSGVVRVKGDASEGTGASGHGGLVVVEGNASSRCGISMKGCDIVVAGSVGHVSGFMAQAGRMVICGDAGPGLGDSLYEAVIYVAGAIQGLGADAEEQEMTDADAFVVADLLGRAGIPGNPGAFRKIVSARTLYHWNSEHHQDY